MPLLINPSRRDFLSSALGWVAAPGASTHWALLSDTHIPFDRQNAYRGFRPYDNLEKVLPDALRAQPDGILINGDLARLEGLAADYEALAGLLSTLTEKAPVLMALGNHDHRKNFLTVFTKTAGMLQPVQNKYVLVLDRPPVRLVVLDSPMLVNQVPGLLGKDQRTWLAEYLRSTDQTPTLIFVHHTLDDKDGSLLDTDRFFQIVTRARKVKAVIYGHSHAYGYAVLDGMHLINLPAVGYNFSDREPVGWVDAILTGSGGHFRLRAIGGDTRRDGTVTSLRWRH